MATNGLQPKSRRKNPLNIEVIGSRTGIPVLVGFYLSMIFPFWRTLKSAPIHCILANLCA